MDKVTNDDEPISVSSGSMIKEVLSRYFPALRSMSVDWQSRVENDNRQQPFESIQVGPIDKPYMISPDDAKYILSMNKDDLESFRGAFEFRWCPIPDFGKDAPIENPNSQEVELSTYSSNLDQKKIWNIEGTEEAELPAVLSEINAGIPDSSVMIGAAPNLETKAGNILTIGEDATAVVGENRMASHSGFTLDVPFFAYDRDKAGQLRILVKRTKGSARPFRAMNVTRIVLHVSANSGGERYLLDSEIIEKMRIHQTNGIYPPELTISVNPRPMDSASHRKPDEKDKSMIANIFKMFASFPNNQVG